MVFSYLDGYVIVILSEDSSLCLGAKKNRSRRIPITVSLCYLPAFFVSAAARSRNAAIVACDGSLRSLFLFRRLGLVT
jgi:hypothetical protein